MFASNQAGLNLLAMLGQQAPPATAAADSATPSPSRIPMPGTGTTAHPQHPQQYPQQYPQQPQQRPPPARQAAPHTQPQSQPHPQQRAQAPQPVAPLQQRAQAPRQAAQPATQAPPPAAHPAAAAPPPANHAGMHLMAMLGVPMPAATAGPAMPKPASEPKLHPDDEEETIVIMKKKPSATSVTQPVAPQQPATTTPPAAAVLPFTPVRHADYARPAAVTAMMADVRARKGYDKQASKEPPKQRRAPTMPDGTIGFHEGRAAAGLPTVYLNAANLTGRSLTPPEQLLPPQSHLMNPHERVRRVSTEGGMSSHQQHQQHQYPHARGFNNGLNNNAGAHPGHTRGLSHHNAGAPVHARGFNHHNTNNNSGKEEGRRPSFHGSSHGNSPAKPKPPTLAPKAGVGAPLPSALSTQNSWRVLAEAA